MHKHTPRFGLTIVEILVSIGIIALLMGLLMPALRYMRESNESMKASIAARGLMHAYLMYAEIRQGHVVPAHLLADQATKGVEDEFGNKLHPPVSQRWVYRLAPYFNFDWAGTILIGRRAELLEDQTRMLATGASGAADWAYQVSVFPAFGINRRFMGGDYRRPDWIAQRHHLVRIHEAFSPSELITFASSRFFVGANRYDGYIDVDAPPLGAVYDEEKPTDNPANAFGYLHPRYQGRAVVGWLDGHTSALPPHELLDRRNWANEARRKDDPNWEP